MTEISGPFSRREARAFNAGVAAALAHASAAAQSIANRAKHEGTGKHVAADALGAFAEAGKSLLLPVADAETASAAHPENSER